MSGHNNEKILKLWLKENMHSANELPALKLMPHLTLFCAFHLWLRACRYYHIHDHWNKVIVLISFPLFFFLSYHPCLTYCRLPNGHQCLFAAKDDREMMYWVCRLDAAGAPPTPRHGDAYSSRNPAAITTIPPPTSGSPTRSERFKNLIKGGISALLK